MVQRYWTFPKPNLFLSLTLILILVLALSLSLSLTLNPTLTLIVGTTSLDPASEDARTLYDDTFDASSTAAQEFMVL